MVLSKLTPVIHDKVWGSSDTLPFLANPEGRKIGEIWFAAPDVLPILVKLLFTSERLSVQVHPDDSYARSHGSECGKTEMWHILRAEPGATVALGLNGPASKALVRSAALDGTIVDLLRWVPANAGDTFLVPAGTIHAIGAGLTLCEIQQYSDVTYRLFDYQRQPERPLHLDDSMAVSRLEPIDARHSPKAIENGRELLANCEYFRTERLHIRGSADCPSAQKPAMYVSIAGQGKIAGQPFVEGEAWLAPASSEAFSIDSPDAVFVIARQP